jgi:hypothetical protein
MNISSRFFCSIKAAGIHFLLSMLVAALAAALVFGIWYPYPFRELAGGRELFLILVGVDVACGPLLTMVIFNPRKPRTELLRDLCAIALIQLTALGYGMWSVWQARPLYLVQEVDRFKVVSAPALDASAVAALQGTLQPRWLAGPQIVAIREPKDAEERQKVMFESLQGGRDFGERAEFYLPYEGKAALKSINRAKPLSVFLQKHPDQQNAAQILAMKMGVDMREWLYLPIVARQDWVAVIDKQGQIQGFLRGDGF